MKNLPQYLYHPINGGSRECCWCWSKFPHILQEPAPFYSSTVTEFSYNRGGRHEYDPTLSQPNILQTTKTAQAEEKQCHFLGRCRSTVGEGFLSVYKQVRNQNPDPASFQKRSIWGLFFWICILFCVLLDSSTYNYLWVALFFD